MPDAVARAAPPRAPAAAPRSRRRNRVAARAANRDASSDDAALSVAARAKAKRDRPSAAPTPDALAALSNPNSRLPRNAKAALRRAVPAVNEETREIQRKLEDAAYLMRIPQRKPWATMAKDVDESRKIMLEKKTDVFENVRSNDRAEEEAYARLDDALERLSRAAATQDFDTFDAKIAQALDSLSVVQIAQAPGLPFQIPAKYQALPKLVGRATVELKVRNADGGGFGLLNGDKLDEATIEITVDGYNAPVTAGNFVDNVKRGVYDNAPLRRSETSIMGGTNADSQESVPLEIKSSDSFDPLYRSPLDVQSGEAIPSIPLSINGSVAMARSSDGQSDKEQFFVYLFDKRSAGLGGLSFEEGEFAVFGYVTKGEEYLGSIGTNARITSAKVTSGGDKLANARTVVEPVPSDFSAPDVAV